MELELEHSKKELNKDLDNNHLQQEQTLLDEIKDFINQLWILLKQDFNNSILFISSNKSFFTTTVLLVLLLQVSNVSSLGSSFEKYCGKHIMKGGSNISAPAPTPAPTPAPAPAPAPSTATPQATATATPQAQAQAQAQKPFINKKNQRKINKTLKRLQKKEQKDFNKGKIASLSDISKLKEAATSKVLDKKELKEQEEEMKANKERLSFFENIKKKFQSTLSPGALGGPVFGKLDLIFDSVKSIFYIIGVILTIVGIISLPVLVFLIITYYVLKTMVSKFIIL